MPQEQPKQGRLWLTDGSCVRLRSAHRNHAWSHDFAAERTHDGGPLRLLTIIDEYTRECLAIDVGRRLGSEDVLVRLSPLFLSGGIPDHIRSDNGPEFTALKGRRWLAGLVVETVLIEPGSPWENGHNESLNGELGDELLKVEIFHTLLEAEVLAERWRMHYNTAAPPNSSIEGGTTNGGMSPLRCVFPRIPLSP